MIEGVIAGIIKGIGQPLLDKYLKDKADKERALAELESEAMPYVVKALQYLADTGVTFAVRVRPGAGAIEIPGYDPNLERPSPGN